jgi:PAS domain S-box-containing protein
VESSFRASDLLEAAGDAIVAASPNGSIVFWNRAAERIFGFSRDEALGKSLDLIIPERQRRRHWVGYAAVMKTGTTRYGAEVLRVPALHKDGRRLSIAFTVALLCRPDGGVESIAAIIRDETQRYAEDRELRERLAELEEKLGRRTLAEAPQEETIVAILARLRSRGFDADLRVRDGRIEAPGGRSYSPNQLRVVEVRRVEGSSDPADMAAVYAVAGPGDLRGVLVDAFGAYSDPEVSAAIQHMRPARLRGAGSTHRAEGNSDGAVAVDARC